MRRFAALFEALDATTRTGAKVAALAAYFREAPDQDRVWTMALLSGHRPKRTVNATELTPGRPRPRACPCGWSRRRIRSSAIWPKRSP